jgi:hypothetical protein
MASDYYPTRILRRSKPKSRREKLWGFMNSTFGIFLFSSIFLGTLSFIYNQWVQQDQREREMEKLDLELGLRISGIYELSISSDTIKYSNLRNIDRVMAGVDTVYFLRKPIFNEFVNKNINTLLWQLFLVAPKGEKREIRKAIDFCIRIREMVEKTRYKAADDLPDRPDNTDPKVEDSLEDQENILKKDYGQSNIYKAIRDLYTIRRWQQIELTGSTVE